MAPVCTWSSKRGGALGAIARRALAVLTGAALLVSAAGDADAYVVKKTSRGELVHWEQPTVRYTVDPSVDRAVDRASDAVATAMDSWSGTVGAPELAPAAVDDRSPVKPGFDQKNGVFYMKDGYEPAGRALAITVLTYDNATGSILDADVIFNGDYPFEVLPVDAPGFTHDRESTTHLSNTDGVEHDTEVSIERSHDVVYDLHHVIAHELGHSLGMNDELGNKSALMYRYSAPNDASIRQPASDDIAGLAELYSDTLDARGNGCGSATVAPKKPSGTTSQAAMLAALGLLVFLVLRARSDRRARAAFLVAAAATTIGLVPTLSGGRAGVARAAEGIAAGHARAKVLRVETAIEDGLFKTRYALATKSCRAASCPKAGHGVAWGGTIGNVTQEVGGAYAPVGGDEVDVSFAHLPSALAALSKPLAGRAETEIADADVTVVTRAR